MSGRFVISAPAEGVSFPCGPGETVLAAMRRAGVFPGLWGCCGGGCGVCKIRVLSGAVRAERMSRDHVSREEEALGCALACRIRPESDLVIGLV